MNQRKIIPTLLFLFLFGSLESTGQGIMDDNYLVKIWDETFEICGYANPQGDTIIPLGKYSICFTDTFRTYAIVAIPEERFIAIDRRENMLYEVFPFDNGPDYPSEGLFRIIGNNKIGYADQISGKVIVTPQFDCAWPFENGVAEVSIQCETVSGGEHTTWQSDKWYYIDKRGRKVERPFPVGENRLKETVDINKPVTLPVYIEINDPIYIIIKDRVVADMLRWSDTTSAENKSLAAQLNDLSEEKQKQLETLFIKSITDYTSRTHFNIGTFILNFNELGRMDSITIAKEFDIRVQFLGNDTYAAEFWEKERNESPTWVMALLYVRKKDGSVTFQDPFQPVIDFLRK